MIYNLYTPRRCERTSLGGRLASEINAQFRYISADLNARVALVVGSPIEAPSVDVITMAINKLTTTFAGFQMPRLHTPFVLCTLVSLANLTPSVVHAEGIVGISPEAPAALSAREYGIDLSTGDVRLTNDDISVGSGEFPARLNLSRTYSVAGFPVRNLPKMPGQNQYTGFGQGATHNLLAFFTRTKCNNLGSTNSRFIELTAVVFGKSYHFSGGGCIPTGALNIVNDDDEGASFRIIDPNQPISTYELITREGIKVLFNDDPAFTYDILSGRYASVAEFPNGDFVAFTYQPSPSVAGTARPSTVYNSRGYGLQFGYKSRNQYFPGNTLTDSSLITSVTSFKRSSNSQTNLASVGYLYNIADSSTPSDYFVARFKNAIGDLQRYTYDEGRPTGIFLPNNLTDTPSVGITYGEGTEVVGAGVTTVFAGIYVAPFADNEKEVPWSAPDSVTDALGNVTKLQFSSLLAPTPISVVLTSPNATTRRYATIFCSEPVPQYPPPCPPLYPNFMRMPSNYTDENGRSWSYKYDVHGRPLATTNPEGAVNSVLRDGNGNVTEIRNRAKPGSGLPDIVSAASFVACTASNYKFCNKPSYTIDPRGTRWDFQYDPLSGELEVALAPADSSGRRAVTRYTYTAFSYVPVAVPPLLTTSNLYLLTIKDTCLVSSVMSTAINFSYICPAVNRVRETYTYTPSSYELSRITPDADASPANSFFEYDNVGNVTSTADLRGSVSYKTYDLLRRNIFEIGSDPDGAGPLPRPIVRHVYDSNSNEIRTETGTGLRTDGADFVIVRFVRRTFDLNDNLTRTEEVTP